MKGDGKSTCIRCGYRLVFTAKGRPSLCWLCGLKDDRHRAAGERLRDRIYPPEKAR